MEFEIPGDAKEAIDNMDQSELFGRVLKVAQAKPQKDANEGLGSKTAVWEQVWLNTTFYSRADMLTLMAGGLLSEARRERRRQDSGRERRSKSRRHS